MATRQLLDREFLRTLQQLTLVARDDLSGTIGVDHASRKRGSGLEFADYRRYSSGDDPRFLDWSAYMRLGKLFLKLCRTEEHIPVRVLLDVSRSMDNGGEAPDKFTYAQRLAATFVFLALLHLDSAVVVPFSESVQRPLAVAGGRERFWPAVQFLSSLACSGHTQLLHCVKQFLGGFPGRGVAVIISDFFEGSDETTRRAIEMLRFAGHDFLLLQVHTPEEQRPAATGELLLQEVETGETRAVEFCPQAAACYEAAFLDFSTGLKRLAVRNGGRYARAVTSVPYQEFILQELRGNRVLE